MSKRDIDLAVYACGPGHQYLAGEGDKWRFRSDMIGAGELLIVPAERPARLLHASDGDPSDTVRDAAAGLVCRRVAVGDRPSPSAWTALIAALPAAQFVPANSLLTPLRLIKDDGEQSILKKAAAITDQAVMSAVASIREGTTMRELQLGIEHNARLLGATGTSFDIVSGFIQEGPKAKGAIFSYDLDEGLRTGTTIFFDVGFVVDGYCSDWGRSLYYGTPAPDIRAAYSALQKAVVETVAGIQPGQTRVSDIYPSIETSLDRSGYGDFLRARLPGKWVGHQIGIEVHEVPWLEPQNDDVIQPGMVFLMEPKLWDDGRFYLRVEDMVLVTEDGAQLLTTFDRELFEI